MSETTPSAPPVAIADALATKYLDQKLTAGLVMAVVDGGDVQTHCFSGGNGASGGAVIDENTLFEIGSITKVFTTTLLADMSLKGEVGLDDPANRFLPDGVRLPNRKGVEITLRHLATHTSGLPRLPGNLGFANLISDNPYARYGVDDLYACLKRVRLKNVPGRVSRYSNLGAGLLGHVLCLAAGSDYERLVKERICRPLGMADTTIALTAEQQQRMAQGHAKGKPVSNWDFPTLAGAGALRSTIRDMLKFLHANIEPDSTPLADTVRLTHELQTRRQYRFYRDFGCMAPLAMLALWGGLTWGPLDWPFWAKLSASLALGVGMFLLWPTGLDTMGLGWHIIDDLPGEGRRYLWHNGGTGGFASFLGFDPAEKTGVVLLANSDRQPDGTGFKVLDGLHERIDGDDGDEESGRQRNQPTHLLSATREPDASLRSRPQDRRGTAPG
jgi:CubicO group peptidase (beta-lactamase class C family)